MTLVLGGCGLDGLVEPEAVTDASPGAVEPGQETAEIPPATSGGVPGGPPRGDIFRCHRSTQLNGNSPLIIVNGIPYAAMRFNVLATLGIESMEVIRAADAAEEYGEDGKNGAIVIVTTQSGGDGKLVGMPGEPSN